MIISNLGHLHYLHEFDSRFLPTPPGQTTHPTPTMSSSSMRLVSALALVALAHRVSAGTTFTYSVYRVEKCTDKASDVTIDTAVACNPTPDSSNSAAACTADKVTYTNW